MVAASCQLGFRSLRRVARALSTEFVVAFVALAALAAFIAALVAFAVNSNMGGLVHAENITVHLVPGIRIHFQTIAF